MHYVVTGAAGFIGSRLIEGLNREGVTDIIAVDNLQNAAKFANLAQCEIADYLDKREFLERLEAHHFEGAIEAVFHQGACSDTMETDGRYLMENNFAYSRRLLDWCQEEEVPLVYASSAAVYGASTAFREERPCERPLNVYGYSKFLFDQVVRRRLAGRTAQVAGFRYFNVYGPRASHKGRMASVAFHFFNQYAKDGRVRLFEGSAGYGPGEQVRDFVSVEDAVKVNLFFLDHPEISGIFNVGTGKAQTFNDVACATVNAVRRSRGQAPLAPAEMRQSGVIEYIPFPPQLVGKYQSYTQADVTALRSAGYREPFLAVEEGVGRYVASRLAAGEGA